MAIRKVCVRTMRASHLVQAAAAALLLSGCQMHSKTHVEQESVSGDRPERALQGQTLPEDLALGILPQPYSKGVRVVGHSDVWGRDSNVQLSWIDHCAYISSTGGQFPILGALKADPALAGVAVIDVSDPRFPKTVRLLRDRGSIHALETMHAVAASDRKILVAGAYGGGHTPKDPAWLDIYDASDCVKPNLMAEYRWPENVHAVTVSPNGKRVYGTSISPFTGNGGIHVLDVSDLSWPRYLGKFAATRADGTSFEFATHEVSISPDERRIYAGVIASKGGDFNRQIATRSPSPEGLGPNAGGVYILDNTEIVTSHPDPRMRLIGTAQQGGWHSVMQAKINGVPHLIGGGELGACPGAWPKVINIADETRPFIVGEFKLAMNQAENCPPLSKAGQATGGIVGDPGTASLHFNDVDSAEHTRLGLFQFMWAGLRIVDLREPAKPIEVGYFKPGDACSGHVRYLPDTGHIWLSCGQSGFYVIELAPKVRASIGLPQSRQHVSRSLS